MEELLRLPFPLPDTLSNPVRAREIVREVSRVVDFAAITATGFLANRYDIVKTASASVEGLIDEYFDILPLERALIDDTIQIIIPSVRPSRTNPNIPTIAPVSEEQQNRYVQCLCDTLSGWAVSDQVRVQGEVTVSSSLGFGVAVLTKRRVGKDTPVEPEPLDDLLKSLQRLREITSQRLNTIELIRGAKVFDRDRLYVVKPIGQRFWTQTAALNDADEIAGTILMQAAQGVA